MDLETISPAELGGALRGVGVNILTRDVARLAAFAVEVFAIRAHRVSTEFALLEHDGMLIQLHADVTFAAHPLHALLPESAPRGAGVQIYLFGIDPDAAAERAEPAGGMVIAPPADKPHGLREATILAPEGQAFTAAQRL